VDPRESLERRCAGEGQDVADAEIGEGREIGPQRVGMARLARHVGREPAHEQDGVGPRIERRAHEVRPPVRQRQVVVVDRGDPEHPAVIRLERAERVEPLQAQMVLQEPDPVRIENRPPRTGELGNREQQRRVEQQHGGRQD
jgi:hypothetical protein